MFSPIVPTTLGDLSFMRPLGYLGYLCTISKFLAYLAMREALRGDRILVRIQYFEEVFAINWNSRKKHECLNVIVTPSSMNKNALIGGEGGLKPWVAIARNALDRTFLFSKKRPYIDSLMCFLQDLNSSPLGKDFPVVTL